ncbi:MAG: 16S rRNA (guanine(527)-N(7))-methyltransferase RsmG [Planctomycetota bacterium]
MSRPSQPPKPAKEPDTRLDDLFARLKAEPPTPMIPPASFLEACAAFGIQFEPGDLERLGLYLALLLEANAAINLTAVRDADEAWTRHIFDALTLMPLLAEISETTDGVTRVMDIGSGGGVPALPLACVLPDVSITLLEPTAKKARFLDCAIAVIGLSNAWVLSDRAERAAREPEHRDAYHAATARAVGRLNVVAELTLPFLRPEGLALFVKGAKADEELEEARPALHRLLSQHAQTVDTPTGRVVVVRKLRETPHAYPRRDGEPKRDPLR